MVCTRGSIGRSSSTSPQPRHRSSLPVSPPAARERFSHVANFTGYMAVALRALEALPQGSRILDLPAGNGLLADALRDAGHDVVCADINRERPDYQYVDMTGPLPFRDAEFDAALCLEGLEHLVDPVQLVRELARV